MLQPFSSDMHAREFRYVRGIGLFWLKSLSPRGCLAPRSDFQPLSKKPIQYKSEYDRLCETQGGPAEVEGFERVNREWSCKQYRLRLFQHLITRWQTDPASGIRHWPHMAFACDQYAYRRKEFGKGEGNLSPVQVRKMLSDIERSAISLPSRLVGFKRSPNHPTPPMVGSIYFTGRGGVRRAQRASSGCSPRSVPKQKSSFASVRTHHCWAVAPRRLGTRMALRLHRIRRSSRIRCRAGRPISSPN